MLSPFSLRSKRIPQNTVRLMDPSPATTHNLPGLRYLCPSGPSCVLGRATPSPRLSHSASSIPSNHPATNSQIFPVTAKRSARSSCAETSSCKVTSKTPPRPPARSTADTSTRVISPCGTRMGPCRFRTGAKTSSFPAVRYVHDLSPPSPPHGWAVRQFTVHLKRRMRRRSR